ncbi:hypothetical protein GOP47_0000589 [Adiantum capillus-veneris]|uniref:HAT C-terminal dimerisation domain-containing protein n=1 Tax=Adiantum capillus-veneris TaxID=13818 RepID=A0A9D4VDA0_ADICA|nr:hypothetical protein GOP47_0000589 [Adiantum capillus-veneris]
MGCATSRLDASDVILQCKERRRAIKDAVSRRQDFAIAHVAYIQALRNVGIALRRFSEGEVSETSPKSPSTPVLRLQEASRASTPVGALSPPCLHSSTTSSCSSSPPPTPPVSHSVPNGGAPTPIKAASPVPSPALPASASPPASSRASHFSQSSPPPLTQASSPSKSAADAAPPPYSINGMGSPDRASDFSPPFYSPRRDDADDYFMPYSPSQQHFIRSPPPMPSPSQHTSSWFMYDIFDAPPIPYNLLEQRRRKQGGGVEEYDDDDEVAAPPPAPDNNRVRKEEGIPDLEDIEGKEEEEVRSVKSVEKVKPVEEKAPPAVLDGKLDAAENPASVPAEGTPMEAPEETPNGKMVEPIVVAPSPEKEVVVEVEPKASPKKELAVVTTGQGRDLTGAVKHIHTHFARACRSGKDVSSMLETQMVYHHLGFVDVKDNTKVFNAITTHWSRKSSLAMRDAYDDNDTPECGMFGSHASTLERLYAWEKKLYDEVKAGEMIRIAFDRKCQQLHNLDAKGGDPAVIDKTRAALKKLDTRLIVAFRAIHLASMRIQKLTNEELYPQLAELLGGGKKVTGAFIWKHIRQAILEVGAEHVVQVITDNASNCKAMRELGWVKDILNQGLSIINFINGKVRVLAIYRTYSDLELKKPSATRFAAMWLLLERLYDVQNKIQKTMVSDECKEWMNGESAASQQDVKAIQRLCLREEFWQEIKGLVVVILPLYKALRMTDMEGATIGLLWHFMEEAYKEIEKSTILDGAPDGTRDYLEDSPKRDDILLLITKRWDWMKRPIHYFAALLHPAYKKPELFANQELIEERNNYLFKVLKEEDIGAFLQEVINYSDQRGTAFTSNLCWKRQSLVKPLFWWESFGYQLPALKRLALRVLDQDCLSGACERNWSAYSLIHTKIRNKLSTKQLERLIYCRSNLRMLRSMHEMPMARQVNVDELTLTIDTLKSVNKEQDLEEQMIFRELYLELEEIDRRVSRTRSHKKVVIHGVTSARRGRGARATRGRGKASTTPTEAPRTYVRRGSGSGSCAAAITMEDREAREAEYSDEGNLISDGDYEPSSFDSCEEEDDVDEQGSEEEDEEDDESTSD